MPETPQWLTVTTEEDADGLRVVMVGEIDPHTAPQVSSAIQGRIGEGNGPDNVIMDVSGVTFIDSSGLREIIRCHQLVESTGGTLTVARPSATFRRLLDVTGLGDLLAVAES